MGGHPEQQRGRGLWFTGRKRAGNQDAPGGQRPSRGRQARMATIAGCGAAAIALVVGACGSSGSSSSSGGTKEAGGVATYALPPSTTPNYIFPMSNSTYFSVSNISYLQDFLYRPLYWFGNGTQPTVNPSLSLADQPVYNGQQVTITLKNYKWSDGTAVTAQNVLFWINMLQAVGADRVGRLRPRRVPDQRDQRQGDQPHDAHDDDEQGVLADLVHLQRAEPDHPDAQGLGPDGVRPERLHRHGGGLQGRLHLPRQPVQVHVELRQLSDLERGGRPVEAASFNADGNATFVPNKSYSGPVKPTLAQFKEVPFTTEAAEYNVLRSGNGSQKLSVGYLPTTDAPKKPADAKDGREPGAGVHARPAVRLGHQLLRAQHRLHHPGGPGPQAAVLPAGAGVPGQPGVGHLRPAARVRHRRRTDRWAPTR